MILSKSDHFKSFERNIPSCRTFHGLSEYHNITEIGQTKFELWSVKNNYDHLYIHACMQADSGGPQFVSVFSSTGQSIDVRLSLLRVQLHRESLIHLLAVARDITDSIQSVQTLVHEYNVSVCYIFSACDNSLTPDIFRSIFILLNKTDFSDEKLFFEPLYSSFSKVHFPTKSALNCIGR